MRLGLAGIVVMIASVSASAQTPAPPPAPAPGSPAIFKSAADLAAVLSKATVNAGGMSSSNVTTTDQYRVSLVKREKPAGALAHPGNTELLYIVEGSGRGGDGWDAGAGGERKAGIDRQWRDAEDRQRRRGHRSRRFRALVLGGRRADHVSRSPLVGSLAK